MAVARSKRANAEKPAKSWISKLSFQISDNVVLLPLLLRLAVKYFIKWLTK